MGAELRPLVPCSSSADYREDGSDRTTDERMLHWPVRREPGRNVAAGNSINRAIGKGDAEKWIGHRLAPRRKDTGQVQHLVCAQRQHHDEDEAGDNRPYATTDTGRRPFVGCCCETAHSSILPFES